MAHPAPQQPRRKAARRRKTPLTIPALSTQITLKTAVTQRVYNRMYERLKADIYTLAVRTRTLDMDDAADAAEKMMQKLFAQLQQDLQGDIRRTDLSMERDGIEDTGVYASAITVEATFTTPQAKRFLDLMQAVDTLIARLDVLWLNGSIDTRNCKDRAYQWQRRLFRTATRIREYAQGARKTMRAELERRNRRSPVSDIDTAPVDDAAEIDAFIDSGGSGEAAATRPANGSGQPTDGERPRRGAPTGEAAAS